MKLAPISSPPSMRARSALGSALAVAVAMALAAPALAATAHRASGSATGVLRIYLARHGQTDWNAAHRLQGSTDTHLNAKGREQAALLATRLAGIRFDAVYSSALARTRETAAIVAGRVRIDSLAALNERTLGKFQGVTLDSDSVITSEYNHRKDTPSDDLDGGESLEQHLARVSGALDRIRARHPTGTILIVGHGLTNQMIVKALLGLTWEQSVAIGQANDELYMFEFAAGRAPRLWKWIGVENLRDL